MTTQYINKATLNGTSTVYWTTTGAADPTGAQSGYNPNNLTNISVDYATTIVVSGGGGQSISIANGPASGDLTGFYPSPTVVKIRGNLVATQVLGEIHDGYVLTWNNTDGYLESKPAASSLSITLPSMTAIDGYTLHQWKMSEASGTFADTGAGANAPLINLTNTSDIKYNQVGLYSNCTNFHTNGGAVSANDVGNPTSTTKISMHCWVKLRSFKNSNPRLITKTYNPGFTSPYVSCEMILSGTTGQVVAQWASSTSLYSGVGYSSSVILALNVWQHVAITFSQSGGNMTLAHYINGQLIASGTMASGVFNWNVGSSGYWGVGGTPVGTIDGLIFDARVDDGIVRTEDYFNNIYNVGIGKLY